MQIIKRTYYFLITELRNLKKAPLPFVLAFLLPVAVFVLLAATFNNGQVANLPIVVVDYDNSPESRKIIRQLEATETISVEAVTNVKSVAEEMMLSSQALFTVVIHKSFAENIKKKSGGEVSIIANGFYLMYTKIGYKSIAQVLMDNSTNIQIKNLTEKGFSAKEAAERAQPIITDIYAVGNPYFNYTIYLLPGMLLSILQMSCSFSALWIFREDREHAAGRIMPPKGYKIAWFIGKFTPIIMMNFLTVIVLYLIIFPATGIPINASYFAIYALTLMLAVISIGVGALLSLLLSNLVSASQALLVINAASFVFSGYTFPRWAMPDSIAFLAELIPVTQLLDAFFPLFLFDTAPSKGVVELFIMFVVVWGLIAIMMSSFGSKFRQTSRKKLGKFKKKEVYSISK